MRWPRPVRSRTKSAASTAWQASAAHVVVGGRGAQILGRPAEALQRHEATHRLQQRVEAGAIVVGPSEPKAVTVE